MAQKIKRSSPSRDLLSQLLFSSLIWLISVLALTGCHSTRIPGTLARRAGDEILVAGQLIHTGTRVVLWFEPGGYDAYRVERRFSPFDESNWETSKSKVQGLTTPNRYGLRRQPLSDKEIDRVRGGGWDLPLLQRVVDQFVVHFDVSGTSRECFKTLHDLRGLSVHFMLDLDGTIYQTLDVKERAWHATTSNTRSVGIEIANVGAYGVGRENPLKQWYARDDDGQTRVVIPEWLGDGGLRNRTFTPRPLRNEPVTGTIQGLELKQYDFTREQYAALIKLTATLCRILPRIKCDYPRDAAGQLVPRKLPDDVLAEYRGILGHYHIQGNKVDPGPAFQWDHVINNARRLMHPPVAGKRNGSGYQAPAF